MLIKESPNREQAIMEAATKLFLEKGFVSTSTTEIAKEAHCNQALVHYYFRTKERLFEAIFEKKIKLFLTNLLQISKEDIPFEKKLTVKIESHFDMLWENPLIPQFFFSELNANVSRLRSIRKVLGELPDVALRQIQNDLEIEIKEGRVRQMEAVDLLMTILSLDIMVFLIEPTFKAISGLSDKEYKKLLEGRKQENVRIVLNSLRP